MRRIGHFSRGRSAAGVNVLSIGAGHGILVAAVRWGWLSGLLDIPGSRPGLAQTGRVISCAALILTQPGLPVREPGRDQP